MKFSFIEQHHLVHPLRVMCVVLDVSASGSSRWRQRPASKQERENRRLGAEIPAVFRASRETYGRPRMQREPRGRGIRCGQARIARRMRQHGLRAKKARRFRQTTRAVASRAKLYLAVVLDLYSRRVVGWATSSRLTDALAHAALQRALTERRVGNQLIHHSDRGSQYTSRSYQRLLEQHGLTVSMSRKGNCWDNAVVEGFFATLKVELGERFASRRVASTALFDYIEVFSNRRRMHSSIGFISPAEAEAGFVEEAAA